jgi:enterochelin esterase family protein
VRRAAATAIALAAVLSALARSPRARAVSPVPAAPAPDASGFVCTQVMGVSVTGDWFGAGFEDGIEGSRWQALWRTHAFVDQWADAGSDLWVMKPQSPCAARSENPDRVIFTAVHWEYKTREEWQEKLAAVVGTLRSKYPGLRRIEILTMLRGPNNRTCGSDMTVVQPYIDEAVAAVAGRFRGLVVAAPRVEAKSCDVFTKGGPHFTAAGMAEVARLYREQLTRPAAPDPPPVASALRSPEVLADNRVTFRFRAPNTKVVLLAREGAPPQPMQKDEQGVWSLTTDALEPDLYGYSFEADGVRLIDPSNALMKPNLRNPQSVVHVPGPPALPWEVTAVPHGTVHHHFYRSRVVGDERDFYVYTPPGYDPSPGEGYPVLYLLHGFSDDASGWTSVGRAHVILDNLIAQGKARPMLVVMPLGYGAPEIVSRDGPGLSEPELRRRNYERFRDALLGEVVPEVERAYRVAGDADSRAIAGLSMGGTESLFVGLNAQDRFGWIGAFSSGGLDEDFAGVFPALGPESNSRRRLLWIACGTEDGLVDVNRKLGRWLETKGVRATLVETAGAHSWMVWRRNLATFVPLLFRRGGGGSG